MTIEELNPAALKALNHYAAIGFIFDSAHVDGNGRTVISDAWGGSIIVNGDSFWRAAS